MKIDGFKAAVEALTGLDEASQNRIILEIAKSDPQMAERLRQGLFTFEHLANCNVSGVRELLGQTNENAWSIALRGASMDVLDKLKESISQRHYQRIIEQMENIGPQKKSIINQSRDEIMTVAKSLKEEGKLIILQNSDDPMV